MGDSAHAPAVTQGSLNDVTRNRLVKNPGDYSFISTGEDRRSRLLAQFTKKTIIIDFRKGGVCRKCLHSQTEFYFVKSSAWGQILRVQFSRLTQEAYSCYKHFSGIHRGTCLDCVKVYELGGGGEGLHH